MNLVQLVQNSWHVLVMCSHVFFPKLFHVFCVLLIRAFAIYYY